MTTNAEATSTTIEHLIAAGTLDADRDASIIQQAKSLAAAVDADPGNAALWREFQKATDTVRTAGADDGGSGDELQLILAALRGPAPVVNAEDAKPADSRPRGGKAGRTTRSAADAVATSRIRTGP